MNRFTPAVPVVLVLSAWSVVALGADEAPVPLGWCTWLRTAPLDRDPDDAIFTL
jgi:hypothetical protein